uniref:Uncharacterized protein n=1 Tax=Rhizophora mucronata TaxID=61149 RepID=A0A2P2PJE8_RHIMU
MRMLLLCNRSCEILNNFNGRILYASCWFF